MAYFQETNDSGVLYLAPGDNIAVATSELPAGTIVGVAGTQVKLLSNVQIGHKFAVRAIKSGEHVVKYSAQIGSASADIAQGEFVHLQNLSSDYMPSYTLEPVQE
jgi:altronate dehydratase small subunit